MTTNSEGKATIEVKLEGSQSVVVQTWNNALSDHGSDTLIDNKSPVYNKISEMSEGDRVVFSGEFLSDDRVGIREASLTEAGSMTSPGFIVKFSDVTKQ